jgi:hypothetical protein
MTECGVLELKWQGPYSWPGLTTPQLPPTPNLPGVYLQTFPYLDGFLVYAAGITRRPISKRLREHTRKYLSGDYTILDVAAAGRGKRLEHWHGWGWTAEKRREYETRRVELERLAAEQLQGFRLFVAAPLSAPRLLERIEAAIMKAVYAAAPPVCDLADRGMQLSARWPMEEAILVTNQSGAPLYGVPPRMEV